MALDHDGLQQAAHDHLLLHFTRHAAYGPGGAELLVLERGEGPYVYDTRGRRYIDGLSSLFCAQIGYSYGEEMAQAAGAQLRRLAFNTNWGTATPAAIELADRLAALAPEGLDKVFLTGGGSESVETAWKLVRQFHVGNGEPQRTKAIARRWAYHGVTLGALSFTQVAWMKEPFGRPPVETLQVANTLAYRQPEEGDEPALTRRLLAELEQAIRDAGPDTVAMMIAEPVQNAGGCLTAPAGYWAGVREICSRHGILLVADEVITGFGRIGEWFASERYDIRPDLVTVAKGLTSAYAPGGAVLVSDRVAAPLYEPRRPLNHGITFGGHPVSAALALKSIEIFERDGVLENVRALEDHLHARLEELRGLPIVGDVRGAGFFWGVELVKDEQGTTFDAEERERLVKGHLPRRLLESGLLARPDDRGDVVLHIAPPLISDRALLDDIVDRMTDVLEDAQAHMGVAERRRQAA
ncbi:MAG: aspartate aminotransferase family protein [Actinomycetota bacterium]|nr:aspartate aminotransferase family protein [Actinomycetota bacterium]